MGGHRLLDPSDPAAWLDPYDVLIHAVAPRPIAFVSTLSPDGADNLAPFSFFMAAGAAPPSVCFSPCTKADGQPKDTLRNIQATGEYVINIVNYEMRQGVVQASQALPYGTSEWPQSGFTKRPSIKVKPACVSEAPFALECRLHQIINHGNAPESANYIIGEVVMFHVAEELLDDDGDIHPERLSYLTRMGGKYFSHVLPESMFSMERPTPPQPIA